MPDVTKQFWMIHPSNPRVGMYHSLQEAEKVARIMAREEPGIAVYVLEAVGVAYQRDPVIYELLEER